MRTAGSYIVYTNLAFRCSTADVRTRTNTHTNTQTNIQTQTQTYSQALHVTQPSCNSSSGHYTYSDEQQVTSTFDASGTALCHNSKVIVTLFLLKDDRVHIEARPGGSVVAGKAGLSYFGMYMVNR